MDRDIKIRKVIRGIPIMAGGISIIIFMSLLYENQNQLLAQRICGVIVGIVLIIGGLYRYKTPVLEELFVEDLLNLQKKSLSDEEIQCYLKEKYGEDVYNRVIKEKC